MAAAQKLDLRWKGAVTMRDWMARQTTAAGRQMEEICQGGDGGQRGLDGGRRRGGARRLKRRRRRRRRLDSGDGGGGCGASQLARQRRCRIARGAAPGLGRWGAPAPGKTRGVGSGSPRKRASKYRGNMGRVRIPRGAPAKGKGREGGLPN